MVLIRYSAVIALGVALAGCGQSLFDSRGDIDAGPGGDGGDIDAPAASSCPAGCIGDAAADFDGSPAGSTGRWRYLDDRRTRAWTAMTASGNGFMGANSSNQISTCAAQPAGSAPACAEIPDALVVSSAGATSTEDPALEYTVASTSVIQLSLRVHVPAGSPAQVVRIYRNSREDVLATAPAMPGVTLERAVTLDALAGDRFLVALAPEAMGAANVAVQVFVNTTGAVFPSKCQLALSFSAAAGNNVDNLCGADVGYNDYSMTVEPVPPVLGAGPFIELGQAADIAPDHYYKGTAILDRTGDSTIQMWIKHDALVAGYGAWVFSDEDLNSGGGLGAVIYDAGGTVRSLDVVTCTCTGPPCNTPTFAIETIPYPNDQAWHFLRVTHTGGMVNICLDGRKLGDFPVAATDLVSTFAPRLGKNVVWTPAVAAFDGSIDDVRAFTTALACE